MLSRFSLEKVQLKLEEPFHSLARELARIIPFLSALFTVCLCVVFPSSLDLLVRVYFVLADLAFAI